MTTEPTETRKKPRDRSPSYPAIDLGAALEKAQVLYAKEGRHPAPIGAIAKDWGYSPKSSAVLLAVAALKKYGLADEQGSGASRQVSLSDSALSIILDDRPESPERAEAIREAALRPRIHAELWEKYGAEPDLPSDTSLRHYLRTEKKFADKAVRDFLAQFRRTIEFAKLQESGMLSGSEGEPEILGSDTNMTANAALAERAKREGRAVAPRAVQLPLSETTWATLQAYFPLSEEAWTRMLAVLDAMKPGLTESKKEEGAQD